MSPPYPSSPRRDFASALAWVVIGGVIAAMSWRMDRMESQGGTLHTAPGLWPGIVGVLLALLGVVLALRSWLRARHAGWNAGEADDTVYAPLASFALAAAMFFVYALVLVGHGLPFWLGTALFVAVYVFVFQFPARSAEARRLRGAVVAIACGVLTAALVTLVFERLFYVRLP